MTAGRKTKAEEQRVKEQRESQGELSDATPPELKGNRAAILCYETILDETRGSHLLTPADRPLLVLYSETWAEYRRCVTTLAKGALTSTGSRGNAVLSPLVRMRLSLLESLRKLGADLGLSPVSRKRLAMVLGGDDAPKDPNHDSVDDYAL